MPFPIPFRTGHLAADLIILLIAASGLLAAIRVLRARAIITLEEVRFTALERHLEESSDHPEVVIRLWVDDHSGDMSVLLRNLISASSLSAELADNRLREFALLLADRVRLARWVAGTVVLLGLLGTVLGLAGAISQIGAAAPLPGEIAPDVTRNALATALSNMKSAFLCTIWGISTATFLSLLVFLYDNRVRGFASRVQQSCRVWFLEQEEDPTRLRTIHDVFIQAARHFRQEVEGVGEDLRQAGLDAATAIVTELQDGGQRAVEAVGDHLERGAKSAGDSLVAAGEQAANRLDGAAQRLESGLTPAAEHISGAAQSLAEGVQATASAASELGSSATALSEAAGRWQQSTSQIADSTEQLGRFAERFTTMADRVEEMAQGLAVQSEQTAVRTADALQSLAATTSLVQEQTVTLTGQIAQLNETVQSLSQSHQRSAEEVEVTRDRITDAMQRLTVSFEHFSTTMQETTTADHRRLVESTTEISQALTALRALCDSLARTVPDVPAARLELAGMAEEFTAAATDLRRLVADIDAGNGRRGPPPAGPPIPLPKQPKEKDPKPSPQPPQQPWYRRWMSFLGRKGG